MAQHSSLLASLSSEVASLVDAVSSHVVSVAGRPHRPSSGLAIGGDLVVTVDHAIERDRGITVTANGTRYEAALVGRDPATDLAVLRVTGLAAPEPALGPPPGTGSLVISVSRTASGTVSTGLGVITSIGGPLRTARGIVLPTIIRTDAALRPGTAGGLLTDAAGSVIGITTPALLRGLPVAIPAQEAVRVARRLASSEPLGRGYLGVNVQPVALAPRQQEPAGADAALLVVGVARGGSAEAAGVFVGDLVVRFNGTAVRAPESLQDGLAAVTPGSTASVTVLRGTAIENLQVTIGERPAA